MHSDEIGWCTSDEIGQTCQQIGFLNDFFNKIMSSNAAVTYADYSKMTAMGRCETGLIDSLAGRRYSAQQIRVLAKDAQPNDAIWTPIKNFEKSLDQFEAETNAIVTKLKLQEVYVSQCLAGQQPPQTSVLDLLCK